jgi:hypothetical protein
MSSAHAIPSHGASFTRGRGARRAGIIAASVAVTMSSLAQPSLAQSSVRDLIGDLLKRTESNGTLAGSTRPEQSGRLAQSTPPAAGSPPKAGPAPTAQPRDPREGEAGFEQARKLMQAIDAILQDTAKQRNNARKLPSKDEFLIPPMWTETKEDRERKVRDLLDAAMGVVTDVPIVDVQKRIDGRRRNIRELEERLVKLREKQLTAPKDGILPGIIDDTVDSIGRSIDDTGKRIEQNRADIKSAKKEVLDALAKSGVKMNEGQMDLLLDGVLSGDLVRLVAVFNSAKAIDGQLSRLMSQNGDNAAAARKYFAMHAALFAMLVHAQDTMIGKIDTQYLPKLEAITKDIAATRQRTNELLKAENRPDQQRALRANQESQKLSAEAAKAYRRYLLQQREQVAAARRRAAHDLRIADNTYETVEASYQLRNLMRDSNASFEAIQKLEAPTFEQIFKNEDLRREFENLTRKLDAPSS